MTTPVDTFKDVFNQLSRAKLSLIGDLYSEGIVFKDPLHELHGIAAVRDYFARLYDGVRHCRFTFEDQVVQGNTAMLVWTMQLEHARLCKGQLLHLPGASHIRFGEKIVYHRDYFDVGALLYERVPLLGPIVRKIKARL